MKADFHVHSCFSGDCDIPFENQIQAALQAGIKALCFTEHLDKNWPYPDIDFNLDTPAYLAALSAVREHYADRISIHAGVELGLQPHLSSFHAEYCRQYPFDFVIGSTHLVNNEDPYYSSFWDGKSVPSCIEAFFENTLQNIKTHDCFDAYGHLDYINRYIPSGESVFSYRNYADYIDECLRLLIQKGKALEVNTGGYKAGLQEPNPCIDILKRYRELGGELLTTGSDAHFSQYVGFCFDQAYELIRACGFRYVTIFRERKPEWIKL